MKKVYALLLMAAMVLSLAACAGESHDHQYTGKVTLNATCISDGEKTFTCTCGDSYTEKIAATGEHIYGEPTVELHCVENSKNTYACIYCDHTLTEDASPVGHQMQGYQSYDEDLGESRNTCARCGHYETKTDYDALAMRFYNLASDLPDFTDPAQLQNIESGTENLLLFAHFHSGKLQQHPEDMEANTEEELTKKYYERWIYVEDLNAFTMKYLNQTYDYTAVKDVYFGSGCNGAHYDADQNAVVYTALPAGGGSIWEIEFAGRTYSVDNDIITIVTEFRNLDFNDGWTVTVTIGNVDGRYVITSKTTDGIIHPDFV